MLIVQKYGGTSLGDEGRLLRAARRITALARQGTGVVAVVSAQGNTTDEMIAKAARVNPRGALGEMDAYLAAGEQMSAALLAMTIGALGWSAVSMTGWQAGIHTDGSFGSARITHVDPEPVRGELEKGNIVVVAGFQGISEEGRITTLGRGGSDTTAVAGIYDRDPRRYPDATRFGRIGYERMLSMARSGAQVLHDRCVEMAWEKGIRLEVLSALEDGPGTIVG